MKRPICPYCNHSAKLVKGNVIYPNRHDMHSHKFWLCEDCWSYVGCHSKGYGQGSGNKPFGILANKQLRAAKSSTHRLFDPLWQKGKMNRPEAYKWLSEKLGIRTCDCHIGMFDLEMCEKVHMIIKQHVANGVLLEPQMITLQSFVK